MTHFVIPHSSLTAATNFSQTIAIDISAFEGTDYLSFSLPEFPVTSLSLTETFVDFTSEPSGDFSIGPVDSIAFSQSSPALPGTVGDTEMRIPITLLTTVDKSAITGIRFRLTATKKCTFRCLAIRACSSSWKYAPIDLDTLWNRVHYPPSPNGKASPTLGFPSAEGNNFPILFRSNEFTGLSDPKPVNASIGMVFATGSLTFSTGANKNELALYFRDVPTDNQTMIEMDTKTMADLQVAKELPDFGKALFDARDQEELDLYSQSELDQKSQFNIERKPDESEHTWMEVRLRWGAETLTNSLTIFNADGVGYTWAGIELSSLSSLNLDAGNYILITQIQDSQMSAQIYQLNQIGEFVSETPIFDTGAIQDDTLIKRRKGRFGWWANFLDGDARIENVKSRGLNFGEMVTKEFRSITPVKGVSLYAGSTSEKELIAGFERTNLESVKLSLDPNASITGKAVRVDVSPLKPLQGIVTNPFLIDDPSNIRVSFSIKFPASEMPGGNLSAFLLGDNESTYPINLPFFKKDVWSHIKMTLPETLYQTGYYQLVLLQTLPVTSTSWWIDNLSAKTYTVKWSARPHKSDAWNVEGDRWQEVGFTLNNLNGGVVFPEHGNGLQIRAQALREEAVISDFKAIPQYATLGRLIFQN